eukprot:9263853-Pyramimonas_sp.AAC.1
MGSRSFPRQGPLTPRVPFAPLTSAHFGDENDFKLPQAGHRHIKAAQRPLGLAARSQARGDGSQSEVDTDRRETLANRPEVAEWPPSPFDPCSVLEKLERDRLAPPVRALKRRLQISQAPGRPAHAPAFRNTRAALRDQQPARINISSFVGGGALDGPGPPLRGKSLASLPKPSRATLHAPH